MASKIKRFEKLGSTQQELLQMLWETADYSWNPEQAMPEGWEDYSLAAARVLRSLTNYVAIVGIPTEEADEIGRVIGLDDGTFKYEVLDEVPENDGDENDSDTTESEPQRVQVRLANEAPRKDSKQMQPISGAQPNVVAPQRPTDDDKVTHLVQQSVQRNAEKASAAMKSDEISEADVEAAKNAIRTLMQVNAQKAKISDEKMRTIKAVLSQLFTSQYETQRLTKELAMLLQS